MQRYEHWAEHFGDVKEMPEGSPAEIFAAVTVAVRVNWLGVVRVDAVSQAQGAIVGESKGVSSVSGWQDTVEHVYTGFYGGNDVGWCACAH